MKGPAETTARRRQRIENKKKKLAAFLDIAKLNDNDRQRMNGERDMQPISAEIVECNGLTDGRMEDNDQTPTKKLKIDEPMQLNSETLNKKPKLHGEELTALKQMLRERTKKIRQAPKFQLREMGDNATLAVNMDERSPLFVSDIQHLIMYSQIGVYSPYSPGRWCSLEKYNHLSNVTVLVIENMSLYYYEAFASQYNHLSKFEHKLEMVSPYAFNSDIIKELSMVPLSATQMKKLMREHGSLDAAVEKCTDIFNTMHHFFPIEEEEPAIVVNNEKLPKSDKYSRKNLLLNGWQMIEENFPLPIKGLMERKYQGYTLTKNSYKPVTSHSPMIALDCEMCRTKEGLELTRISIVDENHQVLYDTLVKPDNEIIDYLTKYSGINRGMMRRVTTRLEDVHHKLKEILPPDAILVGQSLSNDLHAMKMMHPYIIDTSVVFNITGDRTRKTKLQTLAREFLREKIQMGNRGHCSSEDSLACMKLVQLKLRKHPYFGDAVMNSLYTEYRAYPDMGTANYAMSMLKHCSTAEHPVEVVGIDDAADKYRYYVNRNSEESLDNVQFVKKTSNKEVINHLSASLDRPGLRIGHVRLAPDLLQDENVNRQKILTAVDKWVGKVEESAKGPTLFIVLFSGVREGGGGASFVHLKRDYIA